MDQDLEKGYMQASWAKESHQEYKTERVDESVIALERFLRAKAHGKRLLDVGCGNGKNTIYFQNKGYSCKGIDFADAATSLCKKNAKKDGSGAQFETADILRYRPREMFSIIIDCGCLHHIRKPYWKMYKRSLLNMVGHDGYYYLQAICDCKENKMLPRHPKIRNWIINKSGHYTHFISEQEIREVFAKDFRILKRDKFKSQNSPLTLIAFYMQRIS